MSHTLAQQEQFMAHARELGLFGVAINQYDTAEAFFSPELNREIMFECARTSNYVRLTYRLGDHKEHSQLIQLKDFLTITPEHVNRIRHLVGHFDSQLTELQTQLNTLPRRLRDEVDSTLTVRGK